MTLIKLLIFISSLLLFTSVSEAKKRCKPLLEKLHNIQAMQRSGYSSPRGLSLRAREDKARDKWWQCEQGAKNKKKTKSKGKKSSKNKSSYSKTAYKKTPAGTPFKTNNVIVIKSKYQGNKKQAWLKFYQQPTQCNRPKSLAVFASCSENKQVQRINFEQEYE
ncbi:hypothetical protein [Candidatus Colwellia aromaticivorans]|uniref:hypothetical protein n=1 Tax=Candidatus Colwellia aromaticivorans TaxID=2267621 RepID=UPI000DF435B4|nr:hypothetical protein [Candidatus Colwellia aromaticivorans]